MRSVAHRDVALSSIVLPGTFGAYCAEHADEIAKLVESTESLLLLNVPTVEAVTMKLVAGQRRLAAMLARKVKRGTVHLVEGTPAELRRAAVVENLHRGHGDDLAELTRQYVDDRAAEVEQERAANPDDGPRKPGRPKTARGEARERTAAEAGTTPEAIRKREARAEAKVTQKTGGDAVTDTPASPPPVDMHGIEAPERWLLRLRFLISYLRGADQELRKLQGETAAIAEMPAARQAVKQALQEAGARIRALLPHSACVFCRDPGGEHGRAAQCSACGGLGYLTAEQAQRVPAEQLLPGAAPVVKAAANPGGPRSRAALEGWPVPKSPPAKAPEKRRGLGIEVNGTVMSARELAVEREPGADDGESSWADGGTDDTGGGW